MTACGDRHQPVGDWQGYYGWDDFHAVQARLYDLLAAEDVVIDATYACPHPPPDAGGPHSLYQNPLPGC